MKSFPPTPWFSQPLEIQSLYHWGYLFRSVSSLANIYIIIIFIGTKNTMHTLVLLGFCSQCHSVPCKSVNTWKVVPGPQYMLNRQLFTCLSEDLPAPRVYTQRTQEHSGKCWFCRTRAQKCPFPPVCPETACRRGCRSPTPRVTFAGSTATTAPLNEAPPPFPIPPGLNNTWAGQGAIKGLAAATPRKRRKMPPHTLDTRY